MEIKKHNQQLLIKLQTSTLAGQSLNCVGSGKLYVAIHLDTRNHVHQLYFILLMSHCTVIVNKEAEEAL